MQAIGRGKLGVTTPSGRLLLAGGTAGANPPARRRPRAPVPRQRRRSCATGSECSRPTRSRGAPPARPVPRAPLASSPMRCGRWSSCRRATAGSSSGCRSCARTASGPSRSRHSVEQATAMDVNVVGVLPGSDSALKEQAGDRRRALRPHRHRRAGGRGLDLQRCRRRRVRGDGGAGRRARAGVGTAAPAHGDLPPHHRRRGRSARHEVVHRPSRRSARRDRGGPPDRDDRAARLAGGWRRRRLADRLRALDDGRHDPACRAPHRTRSAAACGTSSSAATTSRSRARGSRRTRSPRSACTPTITLLRTRSQQIDFAHMSRVVWPPRVWCACWPTGRRRRGIRGGGPRVTRNYLFVRPIHCSASPAR